MLVALPILVLLVPSLAIALARQPVYTAESRLLIGGFNVEAQRVPGFVEASRTLAETYSRLVPTRAISERVAKILEVDVEEVEGHISASSVPDSSLIRVEGTGSSVKKAVTLSAAVTQQQTVMPSAAVTPWAGSDRKPSRACASSRPGSP
jgi:capsular polysaccharide biosynthesis protein